MLFSTSYRTIQEPTEFLFKEKGSKFFAFAFHVNHEDDFKKQMVLLKARYPDATHHCYALVLNPDKSFQKSSDDGEPSNTAGKPILRAILSADLTNIGIVVVRYFGGTMLGVPGLITAYHQSAAEALKLAQVIELQIEDQYQLSCEFPKEGEAHRFLKLLDAKIQSTNYTSELQIVFIISRSKESKLLELKEKFYFLQIAPL